MSRTTTITPSDKNHSNGFDLLRLVGAVLVIYGHAFPLTGKGAPGFLGNHIQTIGVKIFFVISGYLIAKSWLSDPNLWAFTRKRLLRIMPGLTLNIVVVACIAGPFMSHLSLRDYFLSSGLLTYFRNLRFFPVYNLPGVFEGNVYPTAVNGSLWSLPVEMLMYVTVPILLVAGARNLMSTGLSALLFAVLALAYVRITPPSHQIVFYGTDVVSMLEVAVYFQIGSACALIHQRHFSRPIFSSALLLGAASSIQLYVAGEIVLMMLLPYCVLSLGTARWAVLSRSLNGRDYSYGIYLYGFPVQQALMARFEGMSALHNFLIALPVSTLLAAASWHLLERPMLKLKSRRIASF